MLKPIKNLASSVLKFKRAVSTLINPRQMDRWRLNAKTDPSWDSRNELVAALIEPGLSLFDIGAGAQTIRKHVQYSKYTPCDVVKSTPDTIVVDLNDVENLPDVEQHDVAILSGVVEYLYHPSAVFRWVSSISSTAIISFCPSNEGSSERIDRLASGWLCHLTLDEFEGILAQHWQSFEVKQNWGRHRIYVCSSPSVPSLA